MPRLLDYKKLNNTKVNNKHKLISIIYDFDGVIAESHKIKTEAFRKIYSEFDPIIAAKVVEHHLKNTGISRFEKIKYYHSEYLNIDLDDKQFGNLLEKFSSIVFSKTVNAEPVKGSIDFLQKHTNAFNNYIITATPTEEINRILIARNIIDYFDSVYGSPEKKDYWVKKLLSRKIIESFSTLFIGDAIADYEAATKNDIKFILRKTNENINLQNDLKTDMIDDFLELPKLIKKLFV